MLPSMFLRIFRAFSFPVFLFLFHITIEYGFRLYGVFPWIDIPMHFLGGVAIAFTMVHLYFLLCEYKPGIKLPALIFGFNIVAIVTFVAVGWELLEFAGDQLLGTRMQLSLPDTMGDLLLGMLGGLLGVL